MQGCPGSRATSESAAGQRCLSRACSFHHLQVSCKNTCHQIFRPAHHWLAPSSCLLLTSKLAKPREQRGWFQTMCINDIHEG